MSILTVCSRGLALVLKVSDNPVHRRKEGIMSELFTAMLEPQAKAYEQSLMNAML